MKYIFTLFFLGCLGYAAPKIQDADIKSDAAIAFSKLASLTSGNILVGNGSNVPTSTTMSGDATLSNTGALTIANNAVSNAKLRQSVGLSVIGRSANTTGDVADVTAGSDFNILRRSGTSIGFGSIDLSQSGAVGSSVLPVANGGTGQSSYTDGQLLIGNTATGGLTKSTLTAGSGITVTNGNGSITLSATAAGWTRLTTFSRVTGTAPTSLGQYRSYLRQAASRNYTETNGAPAVAPNSTDGFPIYRDGSFSAGSTSGNPVRYEIFVGTNKNVQVYAYDSTGRAEGAYAGPFNYTSTNQGGFAWAYTPGTGIVSVVVPTLGGGALTGGSNGVLRMNGDTSSNNPNYFDVYYQ